MTPRCQEWVIKDRFRLSITRITLPSNGIFGSERVEVQALPDGMHHPSVRADQ